MTATVAATEPAAPDVAGSDPSLRPGEWATIAYVFGLLVLVLPNVSAFYWTPKAALLLVGIVPGLVVLAQQAVGRSRSAIAASAFLVVAAIATVASPSPKLAVVGLYNDGTGLVLVAALVAAWALGRRLSPRGAELLGSAVLVAAVLNAVMTWFQMSSDFSGALFGRVDGRAPGLLGNPVHVSALLVGAFAIAIRRSRLADRSDRASRVGYLAAAALFASGVQLSGGRTGLLLLALVGLWELVRSRWRVALLVVAASVVGVLLASAVFSAGGGASDRLAQSDSSGFSGRIDRWALALPAVADRPVLGSGPGLYRRATSVHNSVAAAKAFGAETLNRDGHNLFVEYAVTTGILGVAALAAWLLLAGLGARGELAGFAVFAGVSLLVQPQFVGLTPVLALALGAAAPTSARRVPRVGLAIVWTGALVGLVVAGLLVRGDLQFDRAVTDRSATAAHRAVALLPVWPDPAEFEATSDESRARSDPAALDRVVRAARVAVHRDPSSPGAWLLVARMEQARGRRRTATRAYEHALHWNPQSTAALDGLVRLADARGDTARVRTLCARTHALAPDERCPPRR